ncbi:MAG: hypothetical protein QNL33_17585 [Akkermansiaceae bacterium]
MNHKLLTICLLGGAAVASQGASIGLNLGEGRPNTALAANDVAGVVPQSNWNNLSGTSNAGPVVLNSDSGTPSGASVAWAVEEAWSVGDTTGSPDGSLLNGFFSENAGDDSSITISNVPYAIYDLYVYLSHDRNLEDVILREGGGQFPDFTAIENNTDVTVAPVTYSPQTVSGSGSGNYVRFTNLTNSTVDLQLLTVDLGPGSIDRNAIAGIQLVQVPEPSVSLMGVITGLLLLGRRRRS